MERQLGLREKIEEFMDDLASVDASIGATSGYRLVKTHHDLCAAIDNEEVFGCGYCEAKFNKDDFVYAVHTGSCQYCDRALFKVLIR